MIYDKQSRKRKKRLASAEQTGTGSEGATSNPLLEAWVTPFDWATPTTSGRPSTGRWLWFRKNRGAGIGGRDLLCPRLTMPLAGFSIPAGSPRGRLSSF